MSGIVAAFGPFESELGEQMLARMSHRGPDGVAMRQLGEAWLGSRRLAIVDPDNGAQPLSGHNGNWLIGDGEIYNHRRIRERLGEEGFTTGSDMEAALRLYEELGIAAFAKLWGTFAIAVADDKGGFAVTRDVLGLAPLYWARNDQTVLFASELKAFDETWRPLIEPFPPGHTWTPTGGLVNQAAFPGQAPVLLAGRAPNDDPPEWVYDALRETLVHAVGRSMDTDVPLGILLSGGVDSSIITAIAANIAAAKNHTLKTFAAGLAGSNDLAAARLVADHVGTDHHELVYTAADAIELVPQVIADLESFDPTLVHSAVPNYLVSRMASAHVKVVLVGEGADELFAGYSHYDQHDSGDALHADLVETLKGIHIGGLQRVDRVAGANGIESRMPFLDLDVVELAMALPAAWKLSGPDRLAKSLLRRAFDGWLPDEILWRVKQQFGQGTGMNDVLREHFEATVNPADLEREAGVVDPPLRTREEFAYFSIFTNALPGIDAQKTIGRFVEA